MKKIQIILLIIVAVLALAGCGQMQQELKGTYQNDVGKLGLSVTFSFYQEDSHFEEYLDSRKVDTGTFEKLKGNTYHLKSDRQDFEITLNDVNAFDIKYTKINNGDPVRIRNVGDFPIGFGPESVYPDTEKYKALLD